jgi:hypothetical protein
MKKKNLYVNTVETLIPDIKLKPGDKVFVLNNTADGVQIVEGAAVLDVLVAGDSADPFPVWKVRFLSDIITEDQTLYIRRVDKRFLWGIHNALNPGTPWTGKLW